MTILTVIQYLIGPNMIKGDLKHLNSTPPNIKAMDFNYTKGLESIIIKRGHFITNKIFKSSFLYIEIPHKIGRERI